MPRRIALILEEDGERFRFYYDDDTGLLHVVARGATTIDAIRTFFEGQLIGWQAERKRSLTITATHGIYWARHAYDGSVIIISCFERGGE